MNKIKWLCIFIVLLCACSNKKPNEEMIIEAPEESITLNLDKEPENLYVNSKEGLRVRDEPSLSGNIINILPHEEQVAVIDRSEFQIEIDGIKDYWRLINNNETTGWVFGGYLSNSTEEIRELVGVYLFHSLDMKEGFSSSLPKKFDEYFFEIEHVDHDNFLFKSNIPLIYVSRENSVQFKYPPPERSIYDWNPDFQAPYEGEPFYKSWGEKGGGGTYIHYYYNQGQIIIDYLLYNDINGYLEEWEPRIDIQWLEFQMILQKTNL